MGFIDYKGTKEDNYSDVVSYAHMQQKTEQKQIDLSNKAKWLSELIGDDRYASLNMTDLLKMIIHKYKSAREAWQLIAKNTVDQYVDCEQLYVDLWLNCMYETLELFGVDKEKKNNYLQIFIDKVFRFEGVNAIELWSNKEKSQRYRVYLFTCFDLSEENREFWKLLGVMRTLQSKDDVICFVKNYTEFKILVAYYMYLGLHPTDDKWMLYTEQGIKTIRTISSSYGIRMITARYGVMQNPIYGRYALDRKKICNRFKCILFNFERREMDFAMYVEELYMQMRDGKIADRKVTSILPADVIAKINGDVLTGFEPVAHLGLKQGEKLHYMNNALFYYGAENADGVQYSTYSGRLCLTNQRLFFDSDAKVSVSYEMMKKVIQYDAMPNILQIDLPENKVAFFQVSDGDVAYKCMKLLADQRAKKRINSVQIKWDVDELISKSDLDTYAFVFEYMKAANMPETMKEALSSLSLKLKGLKKTISNYPDKKAEMESFFAIYIPNAVKFVSEYIGYDGAPIDESLLREMETKVNESISTLDAAIETKISQIYGLASMDTMAQADGLRNLLGLKGFVNTKPII